MSAAAAGSAAATQGRVASKLAEMGLAIPQIAAPVANYLTHSQTGNVIYVSGQLPKNADGFVALGKVGKDVDVATAQKCAAACALNIMAVLNLALHGDLDRVVRIVKINCFIACTEDFAQHPVVANGASDLLAGVFGEAGRHARAAVGVPSLPLNVPVEIDAVVEVAESKAAPAK
jgi:enamine deaminase RidA (YjgF/YER057c/UK114 family)